MYLSRIEIFGFKSFAHRVRIRFDKGLTAIVGPNGCGKTNVVDAIRWVLGEQKSSLLRSAKMENIIFNGTKRLKALNLTEVSITIENTRNVLPTEYTEVTVTRRIYRSGESDFLLNQVPCRLKDILDLFTDTGMGSDAYSVIELKMIEEIISNRSEERLKLFEEAAGITRYKQRRKQTFRQLETTSQDLSRIDDLVLEVEKKVRSLKVQVRKAERLRQMKKEIMELDLALSWLSMDELADRLDPLRRRIAEEELLAGELSATIARTDSRQQQEEFEHLALGDKLAERQKGLHAMTASSNACEKELLRNREQLKASATAKERAEEAIREKLSRLRGRQEEEEKLQERIPGLERQSASLQQEYQALETEHERFEAILKERRKVLALARERAAEGQKSLTRMVMERQSLEARNSHLRGSRERLEGKQAGLLEKINAARPKKQALQETLTGILSRLGKARQEEAARAEQSDRLAAELGEMKEQLLLMRSERDKLRNAVLLADSIIENFEGLPEGIAHLEGQEGERPGMGCLSDLLSLQAEHRKALHAGLGECMNYYISRSLAEAYRGIAELRRTKKGKVQFLVLELVPEPRENGPAIRGTRPLLDLVDYPPELANAMSAILGRTYLAGTIEEAEQLARQHPGSSMVTPEGEKCSHAGLLSGGGDSGAEGLRLGRKKEREKLRLELAAKDRAIAEAQKELALLEGRLGTLKAENGRKTIEKLANEAAAAEHQLARIDAEESALKRELESAKSEAHTLEASLQASQEELAGLAPRIRQQEHAQELLQKENSRLQEELSTLEASHLDMGRTLKARQSLLRDAMLELEKQRMAVANSRENREALQAETARLQEAARTADNEGVGIRESIAEREAELEKLLSKAAQEQEELNKLETAWRREQVAQQETSSMLRELRGKLELSRQLIAALEQDKAALQQQLDQLFTTVRLRYDTDLAGLDRPATLEGFNREAEAERLTLLQGQREQFGAVNELAFEEFESEKERLDFLREQKNDLATAEAQLRETIEEINRTALKKFQETFSNVRRNFITIFHELFDPEDEADLLIHSAEDPLEARIEIVAKPKGKKPLSIEQLSGGEKALTALSLLFAIYLVKPSPFCILDEVDAPLDDANVGRFIKLLKKFENNTQFIIVTHNKNTMASCQALYGVTMEEEGVSKLIPVRLEKIRQ